MKTLEFKIEGMTCNQCAITIDKTLLHNGIHNKVISYSKANANISFDETSIDEKEIIDTINAIVHYKVIDSKILMLFPLRLKLIV